MKNKCIIFIDNVYLNNGFILVIHNCRLFDTIDWLCRITKLGFVFWAKTAWPIAYRCRGSTKTHQTSKATTTLSRGVFALFLFGYWNW